MFFTISKRLFNHVTPLSVGKIEHYLYFQWFIYACTYFIVLPSIFILFLSESSLRHSWLTVPHWRRFGWVCLCFFIIITRYTYVNNVHLRLIVQNIITQYLSSRSWKELSFHKCCTYFEMCWNEFRAKSHIIHGGDFVNRRKMSTMKMDFTNRKIKIMSILEWNSNRLTTRPAM